MTLVSTRLNGTLIGMYVRKGAVVVVGGVVGSVVVGIAVSNSSSL